MPPKPKFTKEEVVQAALRLVEAEGVQSLTARALANALGSSPRPLFTVFEGGMDELLACVEHEARTMYNAYILQGMQERPAFKGVGEAYIRFAAEKPKLFGWLFMRERGLETEGVLSIIEENYAAILESVQSSYGLSVAAAERVYRHLWIYSHGIATLCATGMCAFTPAEIGGLLSGIFTAVLTKEKEEIK